MNQFGSLEHLRLINDRLGKRQKFTSDEIAMINLIYYGYLKVEGRK
jgi:hypothetical protein